MYTSKTFVPWSCNHQNELGILLLSPKCISFLQQPSEQLIWQQLFVAESRQSCHVVKILSKPETETHNIS